jgi:hypothetical protein
MPYRITLTDWPITDTLAGVPFVDGVAIVESYASDLLIRLHEMRPVIETLPASEPVEPVVVTDPVDQPA